MEEVHLEIKRKHPSAEVVALTHVPSWREVDRAVLAFIHHVPAPDRACVIWVNEPTQELNVIEMPRSWKLSDLAPNICSASVNAMSVELDQSTV